MAAPRVALPVARPVGASVAPPVAQPVAAPLAHAPAVAAVAVALPVASPIPIAAPLNVATPCAPEENVEARIILDMPATRAYTLVDGQKRLYDHGTLSVFSSFLDAQCEEEVYILVLGRLKLALRLEVPCLEMAPRSFVFPTDKATYGIVVAESEHTIQFRAIDID